jgi:hypothetical protein
MKKIIIALVLSITSLSMAIYFLVNKSDSNSAMEIISIPYLVVIFIFSAYMVISRWISFKKSEPIEDEMSKRIKLKAAAYSYYISLFLWMVIMFKKDKISFNSEELFGIGIVGMSIIFITIWIFLKMRGIKSE